jgi:hypothetical protein
MKSVIFTLLFFVFALNSHAQSTFKGGWNTYQTGAIIHEYTYNFNDDTAKLFLLDSATTLVSTDSLATLTLSYPARDKSIYKTLHYFNARKLLVKKECYKNDNMTSSYEWSYDEKNRKAVYIEDNKVSGNVFRKTYDYNADKKNGDNVVTENSYINGRIEFYTKMYYDKSNVKYKEVRLNDNNKDVVHIESYIYGENGKVKERSVYFPEWKVTRKFQERDGCILPRCYRCLPVGTAEKITLANRLSFVKRLLGRNIALLSDPGCEQYEYLFKNFTNCEITVLTTTPNNAKKVVFRFKEKI